MPLAANRQLFSETLEARAGVEPAYSPRSTWVVVLVEVVL